MFSTFKTAFAPIDGSAAPYCVYEGACLEAWFHPGERGSINAVGICCRPRGQLPRGMSVNVVRRANKQLRESNPELFPKAKPVNQSDVLVFLRQVDALDAAILAKRASMQPELEKEQRAVGSIVQERNRFLRRKGHHLLELLEQIMDRGVLSKEDPLYAKANALLEGLPRPSPTESAVLCEIENE